MIPFHTPRGIHTHLNLTLEQLCGLAYVNPKPEPLDLDAIVAAGNLETFLQDDFDSHKLWVLIS